MTTQPNSGEEPSFIRPLRRIATDPNKAAGLVFHDDAVAAIEQFSQLRAERDFYRTKVEQVQQTALELSEERDTYKAERDRLKEELDKGKSAMKTMSELFSVTSQKCGTLESDNARLAAEVERLTKELKQAQGEAFEKGRASVYNFWLSALGGKCIPDDHFTDGLYKTTTRLIETISRLTAELEAAKGEAKEFSAKAIEFGNVAMTRGDQAIQFQAERDALTAKVRELETAIKDAADALEASARPFDSACIVLRNAIPALLSTPPDEGEKLNATGRRCPECDGRGEACCGFTGSIEGWNVWNSKAREIVPPPPNPEGAGEKPSAGTIMGEQIRQAHQSRRRIALTCWNCPECGGILRSDHMVDGKYCWACRKGFSEEAPPIPRPDTQGDERDQCLCPECCPTTQGEKEYRMLEEDERIQSIDEHDFSGGWKQAPSSAWGQKLHAQCVGHYRRPITPPTETGLPTAKLSKILHDVKHNRTTETGGVE